ncbi:MAG: hypothetical protein H0T97_12130 [Actinobacteria bacterium]|nr:hypothetical protein [Actinomycetota bacterium]
MRDAWLVYLALGALLMLVCGLLAGAWARGRLGAAAGVVFIAAACVWVLDFAAISSDYRDADGFFDCGEDCTGMHFATAVGFLAPPLLIAMSALAALVVLLQRRRARLSE